MLTANPPGIPPMSDSPDFFWSKIKREIQVQGDKSLEVPVPRLGFLDWLDRRRYALMGVAVCLVAAGAVVWLTQAYRSAPPMVAGRPVMTLLPVTVDMSAPDSEQRGHAVETKDDDDTSSGYPVCHGRPTCRR